MKKTFYKAFFAVFAYLFLLVLQYGNTYAATVTSYPMPSIYTASPQFTLKVNTTNIPVIDNTTIYDYAHFSFSGTITIEITASEAVTSARISPMSYGITNTISGNKVTFTLTKSRYLIVKINNLNELIIAADAEEVGAPASSGTGIFNVTASPYNADATGVNKSTTAIQNAINAANIAGGGIVYVPAGIFKCGNLVLKSNVYLYMAGGSVIRGTGSPSDYTVNFHKNSLSMDGTWFLSTANASTNIKIYGRGTIDGNGYSMRTNQSYLISLFMPLQTNHLTIDGIVFKDSGLWGVTPTRSDHITIKNTKHFNENSILYEDDAVDIQECQNVTITHSIAVSEDDTYSFKTWEAATDIAANWNGNPEILNDVVLDDCVAWSRCATYKVGFGTLQPVSNVTVKNSTSYASMRALAVNAKYTSTASPSVQTVSFENIDIERFWPRTGNTSRWLEINTTSPTCAVNNVSLKNINVRDVGNTPSIIQGLNSSVQINGVTFNNILVPGSTTSARTLAAMNITNTNAYINNIVILPDSNLALNKPVTVSSTYSASNPATYAVDGSVSTYWASQYSYLQWIYVDLLKSYKINEVVLRWDPTGYGKAYQVQVSDDASTWTTLKTITNNTTFVNLDTVAGTGRYVRMYGTGRGTGLGYFVQEFEVYGNNPGPFVLAIKSKTGADSIAAVNIRKDSIKTISTNKAEINSKEVIVFPNPATTLINIKISGSQDKQVSASLYDLYGKLIARGQLNQSEDSIYQLTLGKQPVKGLYVLKLQDSKKQYSAKVAINP
jgi:polygalacturonase